MFRSTESEHPRLTRPNREIIFEEFQLQSTNVTDRRRDTQTTCDRTGKQAEGLSVSTQGRVSAVAGGKDW